jgi:1,2-diacylglycerol 3-alpha-glucosyltransferase
MKPRLAIIFRRFGPYHFARLSAASEQHEVLGIEVSADVAEYQWEEWRGEERFARTRLSPANQLTRREQCSAAMKLFGALNRFRPAAVGIPGWSAPEALAALAWCRMHSVPAVLMSESSAHDAPRRFLPERIKSAIVRQCSAAVVGGRLHAQYLQQLGMRSDRIFLGYDTVDNGYFIRETDRIRRDAHVERAKLTLPERYFLSVCRFVEKKNLGVLIDAYADYARQTTAPWSLVLAGDGPLKQRLQALARQRGVESLVVFAGFQQYQTLPTYYALASAFVHPSTVEQWGLVVNEAMASALPVLVSNRCGCAADLIEEGVNGWSFAPTDRLQLAALLHRTTQSDVNALGQAGRRIIERWSPERFARGFADAISAGGKPS